MGRCLISFLVAAGVTVLGRKKGGVQRGRPRLVGHLAQAFCTDFILLHVCEALIWMKMLTR